MKNILLVLLMISPSIYAIDKYNPASGRVQIPAVSVGQMTYAVAMQHQGDLVFKVTAAITVSPTLSNPDFYDLETEIVYMPNVSVGADNYEVYMSHQGDLVFKVSSAIKIETGKFIDSPVDSVERTLGR